MVIISVPILLLNLEIYVTKNGFLPDEFTPTMITSYNNYILPKQIDTKYFVGWPNEGMTEWTHGCKLGPRGHFLEDGHKKVTAKLYEHIRHLGWLS